MECHSFSVQPLQSVQRQQRLLRVETVMESTVCPVAGQMLCAPRLPQGATERLDGLSVWIRLLDSLVPNTIRHPALFFFPLFHRPRSLQDTTTSCWSSRRPLTSPHQGARALPAGGCAKCDVKHESCCRSEGAINAPSKHLSPSALTNTLLDTRRCNCITKYALWRMIRLAAAVQDALQAADLSDCHWGEGSDVSSFSQ